MAIVARINAHKDLIWAAYWHDRPRRRARTNLEGGRVRKRPGMDGAGAAFARNQARPACNLSA